jgi:hypothetical protein
MAGELIPPPELDHPLPPNLTQEQLVAIWLDLLETSEQMLIAGLKATLPPGADIREAVRQVYEERSREHLEGLVRIAERLNEIEARNGGAGRS